MEGLPSLEVMLEVAGKLRLEREREKELAGQRADQRASIQHAGQRLARLEQQLADTRQV